MVAFYLRGIYHLIKWRGRKASPKTDSLGVWRNLQEVCVFQIQKLRAQGKMEIAVRVKWRAVQAISSFFSATWIRLPWSRPLPSRCRQILRFREEERRD